MRGRPALKTYLLARQADLFPDDAHKAHLEKKYPYLQAMRLTAELSIATRPGAAGDADRGAARSEARTAPRSGACLPPVTNRGGKVETDLETIADGKFLNEFNSKG